MKTSHDELQRYEELLQWGTPLDAMLLEKAKAACRGLEILQSGTHFENVIYSKAAIGSEIMLSVQIENISDTVIRIDAIRLKMPWFDDDFRWLKKLSSKDLRECAGYVLPACGQWGFDQSVVLNRLLVRDFKLFPGDVIEGLLLGEGASSIPDQFSDRAKVPMELRVYVSGGKCYSRWMEPIVNRDANQTTRKLAVKPKLCGSSNKSGQRLLANK